MHQISQHSCVKVNGFLNGQNSNVDNFQVFKLHRRKNESIIIYTIEQEGGRKYGRNQ